MKIQRGFVRPKSGSWLGHYALWVTDYTTGKRVRRQKAKKLGPVRVNGKGMTKTQAEQALAKLLVKKMGLTGDARTTLAGFINTQWKPVREGRWRASTKATSEELLKIITDRFGSEALEDIDYVSMQTWLNTIAKTRSGSAVVHCRIFLRSILTEAVEQGFIEKNPARRLTVPKLRAVQRPFLSIAQIKALLKAATWVPRELTLLRLILTTALRPSELFALRWKNIDLADGTLTITETVYRGILRPYTKTTEEGDTQRLVVPEQAVQALTEWSAGCLEKIKAEKLDPDAFVFPTASGTFWLKENYQRRVLSPLAKEAGIKHLNFQVLRRTVATHAQHLGSPKDIATLMRHRKVETAQQHYIQAIEETVKATGEKLAGVMFEQ